MARKKYRVYIEFTTHLSTDVLAKSAEDAHEKIDKLDYSRALERLGGRKWQSWELHGGVKKVCEVRRRVEEYEQKINLKEKQK